MKRKILQKIANFIISQMEKTSDETTFISLYEIGLQFDNWCKYGFNIFLD